MGGPATAAELYNPTGVVFDAIGNLYIADYPNNRIRKVNTSGIISTIAGTGTAAYSGDGGPATAAELSDPSQIKIDFKGNLYIADARNNRIRMVNTAGIISTIAGNGIAGFSGDGGQATSSELNLAYGVALDAADNIYIADYNNNRIRKIVPACGDCAGIEQYSNNTILLSAYPNPASTVLNISFSKNIESSNTIKLIDVTGQTVYSKTLNKNLGANEAIDISDLSKGIYMLIVADNNNTAYKKIIVE
jgi:sugar lactone lactonase YvrE